MSPTRRLARPLHPAAWWVWALGLAVVATSTTNPVLLVLLVTVALLVVAARAPQGGPIGIRLYLWLALIVLVVRVLFRMVLGTDDGGTVLFTLPEIPLPDLVAGIRLGGPVTLSGILAALYDAGRLAALLICVGAANVLADPRRLLRATPGALQELGTAVVLALGIAPQLVASTGRVRRARRLRGDTATGLRALRAMLIPVLEDALDRSIALAAAMDVRGFGRVAPGEATARRRASGLLLVGLLLLCAGTYGVLDATTPGPMGGPTLLLGVVLVVAGLTLAGRRVLRTSYRPQRWAPAEVGVALLGVVAAVATLAGASTSPDLLHPSVNPLVWPDLPPLPAAGIVAAGLAAVVAPPVRRIRIAARGTGGPPSSATSGTTPDRVGAVG